MKAKLTIVIDDDVLLKVKRFARTRGLWLSSLVEETLPFSSRWRGRLRAAAVEDTRYEALTRKYL